jgi:hypothetical protein
MIWEIKQCTLECGTNLMADARQPYSISIHNTGRQDRMQSLQHREYLMRLSHFYAWIFWQISAEGGEPRPSKC